MLLEAAKQGDAVALEQAEMAAQGLCETIQAASGSLLMSVKPIVLAGSVWHGWMEARVKALLGTGFRMVRPTLPPVYGSILEAAALANLTPGEAFEARFRATLEKE